MKIKFSNEFSAIVRYAADEAMRTGHHGIGTDHLVLGMLRHADNSACAVLTGFGIDLMELKDFLDSRLFKDGAVPFGTEIKLGKAAQSVLDVAIFEALKAEDTEVLAAHLLLAVSRASESLSAAYLTETSIDYNVLSNYLKDNGLIGKEQDTEVKLPPITKEIAGALGEQLAKSLSSFRDMTSMPS